MNTIFTRVFSLFAALVVCAGAYAQSGEVKKSPYDPEQTGIKAADSLGLYAPEVAETVEAKPEPIRIDYDSSSVESVIGAFHAIINSAGSQDPDLRVVNKIFAADARMLLDFMLDGGHNPMVVVHPAIFLLEFGPTLRQSKVKETMINVQVEEAGRVASAYSVSEMEHFGEEGSLVIKALTFYHLIKHPMGWKILEVLRTEESDKFQIPAKFLM